MREFFSAKAILINDSNPEEPHMLVLTRSKHDDYKPDSYDLPGGEIEKDKGETIRIAVSREVGEETGQFLGAAAFLEIASSRIKYPEKDKIIERHVLVARTENHDVFLNPDEHSDAEWMPVADVLQTAESDKPMFSRTYMEAIALLMETNLTLQTVEPTEAA